MSKEFEHEDMEEIIARHPIINEWRMAYVDKVVPPTDEEVCWVLSNFIGKEIKFCNDDCFEYMFYFGEDEWNTDEIFITYSPHKQRVYFWGNYIYSPHVLEMIGKFYKGVR